MFKVATTLTAAMFSFFAVVPTSLSYKLQSYDFGNGGVTSTSSFYNLNGTAGTQTDTSGANGITVLKPGEKPTQDASVPVAATLTNPNNTYNKLHVVLSTSSNPTDTKYAIAISSDGFTTTKYVLADTSVGSTLAIANYQTYALWGGATGFDIIGLQPSTTYAIKVSAYQGAYTTSAFGPATTGVATSATTISFSLATTANATPPFGVNFTSLVPGSVFTADANALVGVSSNAQFGGGVYVQDTRNGLFSTTKSYTITSASADLTAAASGYGGQTASLSQASGGPLTSVAPYNGATNNVGLLDTSLRQLLSTAGPVTTGSAQLIFKAKASALVPASTDYTDTTTFIAAMVF